MSDDDQRKPDESGDGAEPEPDSGGGIDDAADTDDELTVEDILAEAGDDGQAAEDTVTVLQTTLEERTRDLQRLNAEFQNYRKRVERDKARAGEQATAAVLSGLLPILDDLDRAREHGDLTGPFGSVAEQFIGALTKQGLESFGEKGDAFDPTVHEAVAHMQMGDVDGPTCIDVMRRGYRLGDRLLRAALVAVAEPLDDPEPADEADAAAEAARDADGDEPETEADTAADGAAADSAPEEAEAADGPEADESNDGPQRKDERDS